jgi:hypothetical protein
MNKLNYDKYFESFYAEEFPPASYSPVNAVQKVVDPTDAGFQIMKSDKVASIQDTLKDRLCKGVMLQLYVKSLPVDDAYKCQHPSEYSKDVDDFCDYIGKTPVEYMTGCKDSVVKDAVTEAVKEVEKAVQKTVDETPPENVDAAVPSDDDTALVDGIIDTLKDDDDFKRVTEKITDVVKQDVIAEMDRASKDIAQDTENDKAAKEQISEDDPSASEEPPEVEADAAGTDDAVDDLEAMASESVFHQALTKLYQYNTRTFEGKYPQNVVFEMSLAQITKERTWDIINYAFYDSPHIEGRTYNNRILTENTIVKV